MSQTILENEFFILSGYCVYLFVVCQKKINDPFLVTGIEKYGILC